MKKDTCIVFDFDGTLYPIIGFDSEQLLIHTLAQDADEAYRAQAQRFIADDQAGCFLLEDFHLRYAAMARRATPSHVDAVARQLAALLDGGDIGALIALKEDSGADFVILSCGTENLAEAFLAHLGIADLFSAIRAKSLHFDEGGETTVQVDIHTPEAKRRAVEELRSRYTTIVACGDGPTDIPMLEAADLGLIIDWGGCNEPGPFEGHTTLPSLCSAIAAYLERVREA